MAQRERERESGEKEKGDRGVDILTGSERETDTYICECIIYYNIKNIVI